MKKYLVAIAAILVMACNEEQTPKYDDNEVPDTAVADLDLAPPESPMPDTEAGDRYADPAVCGNEIIDPGEECDGGWVFCATLMPDVYKATPECRVACANNCRAITVAACKASCAIDYGCDEGYIGPKCDLCAYGYQDSDGDGICKPDCMRLGAPSGEAPLYHDCGNGNCVYTEQGDAYCLCRNGYLRQDDADPVSLCSVCDPHNLPTDRPMGCPAECPDTMPCNGGGSCFQVGGETVCVCPSNMILSGDGNSCLNE